MDQRKVNMLAREYCDMTKRKLKPIIISHAMLPGLLEVSILDIYYTEPNVYDILQVFLITSLIKHLSVSQLHLTSANLPFWKQFCKHFV